MRLEFVREIEGLVISYDHDNEWLYVDWYGLHTAESSEVACQLVLAVLRERSCAKMLNDNTNIIASGAQITDQGRQWMRDLYEAGLRYFGWVRPTAVMDRQISEAALRPTTRVVVATFSDIASACSWLQRQQVR